MNAKVKFDGIHNLLNLQRVGGLKNYVSDAIVNLTHDLLTFLSLLKASLFFMGQFQVLT